MCLHIASSSRQLTPAADNPCKHNRHGYLLVNQPQARYGLTQSPVQSLWNIACYTGLHTDFEMTFVGNCCEQSILKEAAAKQAVNRKLKEPYSVMETVKTKFLYSIHHWSISAAKVPDSHGCAGQGAAWPGSPRAHCKTCSIGI